MDKFKEEEEIKTKSGSPNTPDENKLVDLITTNQTGAEAVRSGTTPSSVGLSTDDIWSDEYKMLTGDQWRTSIAYRTSSAMMIRPNSVDNFIFPAIMNIQANICSSTPEVAMDGMDEEDEEIAEKLTYMSKFNDQRNKFKSTWKKIVQQFVAYGPGIIAVLWDNDWIGGTGPNRWVGDVRMLYIDRRNIYFDPAITDLEERLQECGFINRKYRKKLSYIKERWPERGKYVKEDINDMELIDEGADHNQVWLIEARHRGTPKYVPAARKKELQKRAEELLAEGDTFKAKEYLDMAKGTLKGVHVAYVANGVFLEYLPYEYEDGLYPFAYKVCYFDENSPHGFGEIRNIKVPQIMHNKADEIEIEAMSREGLGGKLYNKGAITRKQKDDILRNYGKGGMWLEVDNIHGIEDREGVKTPASLVGYKEHKQRMVETISQNTPIQQGMSPGSNMPFRAIAELGARTDVRTKAKADVLEELLAEANQLRINRFVQFYTEERYFRIKGADNKLVSGTLSRNDLIKSWNRQEMDEEEGMPTGESEETFVPEFDVSVRIMDEKPTDRNYLNTLAKELYGMQAMDIDGLWYTLDEGKLPQAKEVTERLASMNEAVGMVKALEGVPPEAKAQFMQAQQELLQQFLGSLQGGEAMPQGMEGQPGAEGQPAPSQQDMDAFLESLPPEIFKMIEQLLGQLPPEKQDSIVAEIMMMNENQIAQFVQDMMSKMSGG